MPKRNFHIFHEPDNRVTTKVQRTNSIRGKQNRTICTYPNVASLRHLKSRRPKCRKNQKKNFEKVFEFLCKYVRKRWGAVANTEAFKLKKERNWNTKKIEKRLMFGWLRKCLNNTNSEQSKHFLLKKTKTKITGNFCKKHLTIVMCRNWKLPNRQFHCRINAQLTRQTEREKEN